MAFDGFVTRALVHELSQKLLNSRILKIYQPHQTDLIFNIRGFGSTYSLLISANPTYPRMHLTARNYVNPLEPPMFCMLLRKHLEGGIITDISQVDNERIIHMDIKIRDDLGDLLTKRLIIEIMGRHSNIILINPDKNNMILDGIVHVTPAISSYRQILPGREYTAPPKQDKINPLLIKQEQFFTLIHLNEGKLEQQLVNAFTGFSPTITKEILNRAGLPTKDNLWNAFNNWIIKTISHQYQPTAVSGDKSDFSILPLTYLTGDTTTYDSISECLDAFYAQKAERDTVRQKALDLSRLLLNEKNKNEKKLDYLKQDLDEAKSAEIFKLYGELLTANLYQIKRGDKETEVINYYDDDQNLIKIPLDPIKTPNENAQLYFKKYNKLKGSLNYIENQLKLTKEEIEYLDTILTQLGNADVEDIEDIREELIEQGYLKTRKKQTRKKKKDPEIDSFISSEGLTIYAGKNNKQNDYLTNRLASPTDTWLHTKDIPGSHVVIKGKTFGEQTLQEAALIAAYFSKAKFSSQVPVDYTLIKYVKKPSGAKPGFVIYENQKTLYVTPDERLVEELKAKK